MEITRAMISLSKSHRPRWTKIATGSIDDIFRIDDRRTQGEEGYHEHGPGPHQIIEDRHPHYAKHSIKNKIKRCNQFLQDTAVDLCIFCHRDLRQHFAEEHAMSWALRTARIGEGGFTKAKAK